MHPPNRCVIVINNPLKGQRRTRTQRREGNSSANSRFSPRYTVWDRSIFAPSSSSARMCPPTPQEISAVQAVLGPAPPIAGDVALFPRHDNHIRDDLFVTIILLCDFTGDKLRLGFL